VDQGNLKQIYKNMLKKHSYFKQFKKLSFQKQVGEPEEH